MGCKITSPSCSDFVVVSNCTLNSSSYKHENNQLSRMHRRTVTEKCTTEVTYITNLCNFKSMLGLLDPTLLLRTCLLKLLTNLKQYKLQDSIHQTKKGHSRDIPLFAHKILYVSKRRALSCFCFNSTEHEVQLSLRSKIKKKVMILIYHVRPAFVNLGVCEPTFSKVGL
jgi:hypothetical protein